MKKLLALMIFAFSLLFSIPAYALTLTKDDYLKVSGSSIGIKLDTGVLVCKTFDITVDGKSYRPWENVLLVNDMITKIGDININSIRDIKKALDKYKDEEVKITFIRNSKIYENKIKGFRLNNTYSYGIFVRDSILGVGTLTYVVPNENLYGALGHSISSNTIYGGEILDCDVKSINPSRNGNVGEKVVEIEDSKIGTIAKNTNTGIFGTIDGDYYYEEYKIGYKEDVHKGEAFILTSLNGNNVERYNIEIIEIQNQNKKDVKGMKIKVVDEKLISITGGIVQGMSGSPIIQDDKIIGALTHVIVSNTKQGYGIYLEWMLEDMGISLKR